MVLEFDYYVWNANEEQKAAVDKAMAVVQKCMILSNRPDISKEPTSPMAAFKQILRL